jgi:aldehyde dehydrogenase (NAD+)
MSAAVLPRASEARGNFIGGDRCQSAAALPVINPSNGEVIAHIARSGASEVDAAVRAAQGALDGIWGGMDATTRGGLLTRLAGLIRRDAEPLAQIESRDVGKPISQARWDVAGCARYFEYYGGAADKVQGDTIPYRTGFTAMTLWEPHGVTAHIIPWNYPLQMIGRSLAPALAMGNATVLKPAEDASLSALALAELAAEAGFPAGAVNVVTGLGAEAGAALTAHPGVRHVSFTGSPETGAAVQASAARRAVPVTLELGGKSPQIVFADADPEAAAEAVVRGIALNAGQTCSAGSRLLVQAGIADRFLDLLARRIAALRVGPAELDLDVGAIINARQKARIERYVAMAHARGRRVLAEGRLEPGLPPGGFYVPPMLVAEVPRDDELAREEIFGPILVALPFADEADALHLAEDTEFGLVAGVWTADIGRAMRLSRRLKCGQVYINNFGAGGGVELPFGGRKMSGHGREKGLEALYGFGALKTISIQHGS